MDKIVRFFAFWLWNSDSSGSAFDSVMRIIQIGITLAGIVGITAWKFSDIPWIGTVGIITAIIAFLWVPFDRFDKLKKEHEPRLEIEGISCDIHDRSKFTWPWNCRLRITNRGSRTADKIKIELTEAEFDSASREYKLPFQFDFATPGLSALHPGGTAIVNFAKADYAVGQSLVNSESGAPVVIYDPGIAAGFGPNPPGFWLNFRLDYPYRVKIKAMAQDFPVSEYCFVLRFSTKAKDVWVFALTKAAKGAQKKP